VGSIIVELRNLSRQADSYIAKIPDDDLNRRLALRCIAIGAGRLSTQMARTPKERVSTIALAYGMIERTKATPIPFS
jgi:predicted membrane chloride channel (bestrophin family)